LIVVLSKEHTQPSLRKNAVHYLEIIRLDVLLEEFLKPMGMSANELGSSIRVPAPRINDIVLERRGITADTAVRLASFLLGMSEEFWMNLQLQYEVRRGRQRLVAQSVRIQPRRANKQRTLHPCQSSALDHSANRHPVCPVKIALAPFTPASWFYRDRKASADG